MPTSADPSDFATFTFQKFNGDKIKFDVRFLTRRERAKHRRMIEAIHGRSFDDDATWDKIHESIEVGIVGWEKPEPLTRDAIAAEFTERDLWAFAQRYPRGIDLTEDALGKSTPQPDGQPGSAAETVGSPASV